MNEHSDDGDDLLAAYDLDAWEAPPLPSGIADAVVATLRAPVPASAAVIEPEERSGRRRWWIAGAVALPVAAVAAFALWGTQRAPRTGQGEVVAVRPQQVELGGSSSTARLDTGAAVTWKREHDRVAVAQPRGTAMWTVGADDTVVIDAGATVASVEAHGASLRVEVRMHPSEARVVGASAIAAAAVAMVTVVVYEGHVKVTSAGQTVNVAAGSSVEVVPSQPPRVVPPRPTDDDALRAKIDELERKIDALQAMNADSDKTVPKTPAIVMDRPGEGPRLTRDDITSVMAGLRGRVLACNPAFTGLAKAIVTVGPDGRATSVRIDASDATVVTCMAELIEKAQFAMTTSGGSFTYPYRFVSTAPTRVPPAGCDAAKLKEQAEDYLQMGMDAAALATFEAAIHCKPDPSLDRLAFMSACRAKAWKKASSYYAKLPAAQAQGVKQICIRNGFDPSTADAVPARAAATGRLSIAGNPVARVLIDGKDTGKSTPASFELAPGKHRVTYDVGGDRFTYSVVVTAGETTQLVKDLQ